MSLPPSEVCCTITNDHQSSILNDAPLGNTNYSVQTLLGNENSPSKDDFTVNENSLINANLGPENPQSSIINQNILIFENPLTTTLYELNTQNEDDSSVFMDGYKTLPEYVDVSELTSGSNLTRLGSLGIYGSNSSLSTTWCNHDNSYQVDLVNQSVVSDNGLETNQFEISPVKQNASPKFNIGVNQIILSPIKKFEVSPVKFDSTSLSLEVNQIGTSPVTAKVHDVFQTVNDQKNSACTVENKIYSDETKTLEISKRASIVAPNAKKRNKFFVCATCGKIFELKCRLMRHLQSHRVKGDFICEICGKDFKLKSGFDRHKRVHSTEAAKRKYFCTVCNKGFIERNHCRRHELRHTGEHFVHKCPICEKLFSAKHHLKRHVMIHDGTKPHQCPQCCKQFIQKVDMMKHLQTHSKNNMSEMQ